jgi:magnesium-transporting ATPase (P-type)
MTFVKKDNKKIFIAIRILLTLLVIFTLILLASAFYRMSVYEQAYGFTYLRIFVQTFMIMLFFLSVANIIYIWHLNFPVIKSYFIILLTNYIIMNFANVDIIIARNNIDRYFESRQIDIYYLESLSYDAIPQMEIFLTSNSYLSKSEKEKITGEILEHYKQKN